MSFPGRHFTRIVTICRSNQAHPVVTPLGEDSELIPGLRQTSPHVPFPFADLALYSFVVINHSHEHNYMLNPSRKSPNLRVVLGNPPDCSQGKELKQNIKLTESYFYLLCYLFKVEDSQASLHAKSLAWRKKIKVIGKKKDTLQSKAFKNFVHPTMKMPQMICFYSNILYKRRYL